MKKNLIVVTGAYSQLGLTLKERWTTTALSEKFEIVYKDKSQLDITSPDSLEKNFKRGKIAAVINTAAYTAVDKAEIEKKQAFLLNEFAPQNLASWAMKLNFRLLHISTDFVFSGESSVPYLTTDLTEPLNVYGKSKRAGETAVLKENPRLSTIIRTSWLYSPYKNNFVKSMIKLMSQREVLYVVDDQIGSPTSTDSVVDLIIAMLKAEKYSGMYHWSGSGTVSRYNFALAIQDYCLDIGLLEKRIPIIPISTDEYPTPARRPKYSVLDMGLTKEGFSIEPTPWRESLKSVIQRIADNEK